jgi:hypothetical protein
MTREQVNALLRQMEHVRELSYEAETAAEEKRLVRDYGRMWRAIRPFLGLWIRSPKSVPSTAQYTADLTAAVALCERMLPGWPTRHHTAAPNRWHFYIARHEADPARRVCLQNEFRGIGTPPVATCIALLIALEGGNDG